jgi:hypothetical protein
MRRLVPALALLLLVTRAEAQDLTWSRALQGSGREVATGVALDAAGNVYVVGGFDGPVPLGEGPALEGRDDAFVASWDPAGAPRWSATIGGRQSQAASAVAVDATGGVVVVGVLRASAKAGEHEVAAQGRDDAFVARFTPDGACAWLRAYGGKGDDRAVAVALDGAGHALVLLRFEGQVDVGGRSLTAAGASDQLLLKVSPAGEVVWARQGGSPKFDASGGVATDAEGAAYVTGGFSGVATFGARTLEASGSTRDAFLVKYTSAGEVAWVQRCGGPAAQEDAGLAVAVSADGHAWVTGRYDGEAVFGTLKTAPPSHGTGVFLACFAPDGAVRWLRFGAGTMAAVGLGVAVDASGGATLVGTFSGAGGSFGPDCSLVPTGGKVTPLENDDVFVASFAPDGAPRWVRALGGAARTRPGGVAVGADGQVLVVGSANCDVTFGSATVFVCGKSDDAFVLRLAPPPSGR